jgi:hypothetical protein
MRINFLYRVFIGGNVREYDKNNGERTHQFEVRQKRAGWSGHQSGCKAKAAIYHRIAA